MTLFECDIMTIERVQMMLCLPGCKESAAMCGIEVDRYTASALGACDNGSKIPLREFHFS